MSMDVSALIADNARLGAEKNAVVNLLKQVVGQQRIRAAEVDDVRDAAARRAAIDAEEINRLKAENAGHAKSVADWRQYAESRERYADTLRSEVSALKGQLTKLRKANARPKAALPPVAPVRPAAAFTRSHAFCD